MRPGEAFETECYEYLKRTYKTTSSDFYHEGGMDSTKSDIAVIKNGHIDFFIEAKDTAAQSGQFVLLPDEDSESFVFSPRNHSEPNEMTDIIIAYMNNSFHRYNNAGTAGEILGIDTSVFSRWIINHYKDKNVKYVISYGRGFVILPIRKFNDYFDISAKYRIKKSGSGEPAKRDMDAVKQVIKNLYPTASFVIVGKKLFARFSTRLSVDTFQLGKYSYYLSEQNSGVYEIRRLSNTYNMNVIFSIKLIKSQADADLREFESDL